jgi:lipopolysaccharide/colanic/teichoic acid biosynthesis glycosyltransferase
VKPGITGLAQVKGFHGPSPDVEEIADRFHWDAWYVEHATLKLDMKIVFQTMAQRLQFIWNAVVKNS